MQTTNHVLEGSAPGSAFTLTVLRFGAQPEGPHAYIQGGLHADEAPGMLCAHHLRGMLAELEAAGKVRGTITLVPAANPIGLSQTVMGRHEGRFNLGDGVNFNRAYPDVARQAIDALAEALDENPERNLRLAKDALAAAARSTSARRPADHLKQILLGHAITADTVLDLHCDGEALNHLYCPPDQAEAFMPLARWLGAHAVLTAEVSGGNPFDEALSGPWTEIHDRFGARLPANRPVACTVELRGQQDVSHEAAEADARAVIDFLALRGHLDLEPRPMPEALCRPTPLAACESIEVPASGLLVFRREIGATIAAGDAVVDIVDPVSGAVTPVLAKTTGVFFARVPGRVTQLGRRIGKIAGSTPFRTGNLLSP